MGKYEKLLDKILEGRADASSGARINLQSAGSMAKPYQVKQARIAIMSVLEGKSN